jgi:Tfp pilus assembly protein PilV
MGVGMLGLSAMQGMSKLNNHSAWQRSQAAFYLQDMADRMRVNAINLQGKGLNAYEMSSLDNFENIVNDCSKISNTKQIELDLCEIKKSMKESSLTAPGFCIFLREPSANINNRVSLVVSWVGLTSLDSNLPAVNCNGGGSCKCKKSSWKAEQRQQIRQITQELYINTN